MNDDSRQKLSNIFKIPEGINQRMFIKDQMDMFSNMNDSKQSFKISKRNYIGGEQSKE